MVINSWEVKMVQAQKKTHNICSYNAMEWIPMLNRWHGVPMSEMKQQYHPQVCIPVRLIPPENREVLNNELYWQSSQGNLFLSHNITTWLQCQMGLCGRVHRGHISCMEIVGSHHQLKSQFRFNWELGLFPTDKKEEINVRDNRVQEWNKNQREWRGTHLSIYNNIIFNQLMPEKWGRVHSLYKKCDFICCPPMNN